MNNKDDFLEIQCTIQGCLEKVRGIAAEVLTLLQRHLVEEHQVLETKGTICPFCNVVYCNQEYLKQHISTVHLGATEYNNHNLELHRNVSNIDQSCLYWCKKCEKKFSANAHWKQHVRSHMKLTYETQRPIKRRIKKNKIKRKHKNEEANSVFSDVKKSTTRIEFEDPDPACPGLVLDLNNTSIAPKHLGNGIKISKVYYTNANREIVCVNNAKVDDVIAVDSESEDDSEGKESESNPDVAFVNDETKDVEQEKLEEEIEQFMQEENLLEELEEEIGLLKKVRKKISRMKRSETLNASESFNSSDCEIL